MEKATYQLLVEAGALLASTLDYETTLNNVASLTVPQFADWAAIDLLESDGTLRRVAVKHSDPTKRALVLEFFRRYPPRLDDPAGIGFCVRTGETRWSRSIPDEALVMVAHDAEHLATMRTLGLKSVIVVPLVVRGRRIGAVSFVSALSGRLYDEEDVEFASELARRVAVAIANARLFAAEQETRERLLRLQRVTASLSAALSPAEVGQVVVIEAREALAADTCIVYVAAPDGTLSMLAEHGISEGFLEGAVPAATDDGPASIVLRTRVPIVVEHQRDFQRLFPKLAQRPTQGRRAEAFMCVPLTVDETTIGVLGLGYFGPRSIGPLDRDLTVAMARQCAQALARARLNAEAISLREHFLSVASHELNTPITALVLMLQTLKKQQDDPSRVARHIDRAEKQVQRLAKLVRQLLDVSSIAGNRLELDAETFNLGDRVAEAVERAGAGATIATDIARDVEVCLDRPHVEQVLEKLLDNAVKHGERKPVDVTLAREEGWARLVVKDRGLGIAEEHRARIFQRFERAVSSRHYGGFGLGLWIARQIVEACDGQLQVESAEGEGTTITVLLPCASGVSGDAQPVNATATRG